MFRKNPYEKQPFSSAFFTSLFFPLTNLSLRDTIKLQKYFRKGEKQNALFQPAADSRAAEKSFPTADKICRVAGKGSRFTVIGTRLFIDKVLRKQAFLLPGRDELADVFVFHDRILPHNKTNFHINMEYIYILFRRNRYNKAIIL